MPCELTIIPSNSIQTVLENESEDVKETYIQWDANNFKNKKQSLPKKKKKKLMITGYHWCEWGVCSCCGLLFMHQMNNYAFIRQLKKKIYNLRLDIDYPQTNFYNF